MAKPIIGFIGLGIIGKPMARNLIRAGYPLVVHNRSLLMGDSFSLDEQSFDSWYDTFGFSPLTEYTNQ